MTKAKVKKPSAQVARLLRAISTQPRLEILLAIGTGEACVCHLEAVLGWRQAYISQHLMALRQADLLETRRDGKYIFYRLANPDLLDLLRSAASISGVTLPEHKPVSPEKQCPCPHCSPELIQIGLVPEEQHA